MRKKITLALLSLLLVPLGMMAQNVTIKATNGSMIASTPQGTQQYDTFFKCGGFATWQHEQLSMVLTASDATTLTSFGQLANPANNLFAGNTGGDAAGKIQIAKGYSDYPTCYLSLTLPKGYRFTGYTIVFSKSSEAKTMGSGSDQTTVDFNETGTAQFGETGSNFSSFIVPTYEDEKTYDAVTIGGGTKTIHRTSHSATDMGNALYFRLQNTSNNTSNRALITLESAEFFFTAEANYTPLTTPGNVQRVSAVDIPFETSKVDYGSIQQRTYANVQRVSYSSANVKDLKANFTLYEADAVKSGADFDGVTGDIVDYKKGSISVENGYYRIGAADASNPGTTEHIYYIETPSYVLLSDNTTKNPVGYRIVGAKIDYKYGETKKYGNLHETYNTFYISYSTGGSWGSTYYMNSSGGATDTQSQRALWFIDDEGYIRTGANGTTYLTNYNQQTGGSGYAGTTQDIANAIKFSITSEGYIYYTENGTNYWLRRTTSWGTSYFRFQNNTGNRATRTMSGTTTIDIVDDVIGVTTQPYTLKVYGKDGTMTGGEQVTVNASKTSGSVNLVGLNNDAIKIGVIGTGLIQGTLTLQALDPYLDKMTVVCQDESHSEIRLEQDFTASDFSVNGGEFYFYLPSAAEGNNVSISFENLKSNYFDETYTGGSSAHNSRINFVRSAHYDVFGLSNNTIYNNRNEAKNATMDRLSVGVVGSAAFKFNNAKDLSNANGILTEYPFSLEKYAAAPNSGSFGVMEFTVSEEDQDDTGYVFTTDETRYNIAPTTAIQHRAYAFYKMIVHVSSQSYEPVVEFKKIYDRTLYRELKADKTYGGAKEDAFFGAVVTATDGAGNPGFASTADIFEAINEAIEDGEEGEVPVDSKHLLYLDFSQLKGIYQVTDDEHSSMDSYSGTNAANCLIFLPKGASAPNNNVAYKMESGGFMAANNIVLTDMQPFYTPYDILLRDVNYVTYDRKIEKSTYDKSAKASVMMPFAIQVENGVHTNVDGTKISLHSMQTETALTQINGTTYAYFPALDGVSSTKANCPYLVNVISNGSEDGSFIVSQQGTLIKACPVDTDAEDDEFDTWKSGRYLFDGESASGSATTGEAKGDYEFTNKGTYAGIKINKNDNVFYYANSVFVSSANLSSSYKYANIAPFRAFYATGELSPLENPSNPTGGAKLMNFGIILGEGVGDVPSGIHAVDAAQFLDVDAPVYDLQGRKVATSYREAKSLSSGMYVVNGVKIVVK